MCKWRKANLFLQNFGFILVSFCLSLGRRLVVVWDKPGREKRKLTLASDSSSSSDNSILELVKDRTEILRSEEVVLS